MTTKRAWCSGMLPGFVAGYYEFDECHVDLARLASLCRVQFVHATATNIDTKVQIPSISFPKFQKTNWDGSFSFHNGGAENRCDLLETSLTPHNLKCKTSC